jgi:hypothetical protein
MNELSPVFPFEEQRGHPVQLNCTVCGGPFTVQWNRRDTAKTCSRACRKEVKRSGWKQKRKRSDADRFWAKVEKTGGCWYWKGGTVRGGYGSFWMQGRHRMAHHVAWELTYGPIEDGLLGLHTCDNPSCVNPEHQFRGTYADNANDMYAKGRGNNYMQPGENHPNAKLSDEQVTAIRNAQGTLQQIGAVFGISISHVWRIKHREQRVNI